MKTGKRTKEWLKVRRLWLEINKPNHEGYYICSICSKPVHSSDIELDHVEGRKGEKLSKLSNLRPTHSICNRRKGSQKWLPKVTDEEYELRRIMDL